MVAMFSDSEFSFWLDLAHLTCAISSLEFKGLGFRVWGITTMTRITIVNVVTIITTMTIIIISITILAILIVLSAFREVD